MLRFISMEADAFELVRNELGKANLFAFGIGGLFTLMMSMTADVIDLADRVVGKAVRRLASLEGGADEHQVLAYEIAHAAAGVATAKSLIDYGNKGDVEAKITCAFTADMAHDLAAKILGREDDWGVERDALANAHAFMTTYRAPAFLASLATWFFHSRWRRANDVRRWNPQFNEVLGCSVVFD